jgi:CRISPR system Cascade subunit CasA
MNLVTEPWIPVVKLDGKPHLASLLEVFTPDNRFADLSVRPHERIALMRLLICIAQAALDGPEINAWDDAPENLPKAARQYLETWSDSFDLFHPQKPFLQLVKLDKPPKPEKPKQEEKPGEPLKKNIKKLAQNDLGETEQGETFVSIGKMDFALASGNNSTLFDHFGAADVERPFPASSIPLMLITFQNFSPGGTIGVALWNEKPTTGWTTYPKVKPGQSSHAPCLPKNMLHAFIRRSTLLDTICANLLTKDAVSRHFNKPIDQCWGKPIWEVFPNGPEDQTSTKTYLGRLVPLARGIRLIRGGKEMLLANGLEYPSFGSKKAPCQREPSATEIINREKTERILLGATSGKAIWRELSALIVSRKQGEAGGPLTLEYVPDNADFDLWVGALVADKANILDTVESVFHVPANLRTDAGRAAYNGEVRWAESIEGQLRQAIREYRKQLDGSFSKVDDPELTKKRKAEMEKQLRAIALSTATRHYWTAVEKLRPLLMAYIQALGMPQKTLEQAEVAADKAKETQDTWRKAVRRAARESYRPACGRETPRQMRAFALGWSKLVGEPKNQLAETEESETEELEE